MAKTKAVASKKPQAVSGPTAPVPKDPQPSVDRIDELARRILSGDILLPKFQRDFVWDRQQILDLLDSIAKNYPIGSVLLWQSRQELRSENRIADLEIDLPKPDYPVNYLLDGQQRLSTICGSIFWDGTSADSQWNIAYDLRQEQFVYLPDLNDPSLHLMPTRLLADSAVYFKRVSELTGSAIADKAALSSRAESIFRRFKDFKIATVTLGDMPIDDVAPIFERINSTGTKLTIVDLMRAATWSEEFDLVDALDAIREELQDRDFGGVDRKVLLRALSSAAGKGYTASDIDALRELPPDDLLAACDALAVGVRGAVDFLCTQLHIPNDAALPYANQFTVLSDLFRLVPNPSAAQLAKIKKWFWQTAAAEYFGGWNTGQMSADHEAIAQFAAGASGQIDVAATLPRPSVWTERRFQSNSAISKVLAIILAYQRPRDLLTGARIEVGRSLAWGNAREYHHFFPKDYLKGRGVSGRRANVLANIVYLTSVSNKAISNRAPSDYLTACRAAAGTEFDAWLASNLINADALDAAMADNYDDFLKHRAAALDAELAGLAN